MADSYIGEIRIFPYTFAPYQWAWCNGQVIPIQQNSALFAVIGAVFGGDGKTTFALPNLTQGPNVFGCAPLGTGTGSGLTPRSLGPTPVGESSVALQMTNIPPHDHTMTAQSTSVTANYVDDPTQAWLGRGYVSDIDAGFMTYATYDAAKQAAFRSDAINLAGMSPVIAHENRQPALAMCFCISLYGEFPTKP